MKPIFQHAPWRLGDLTSAAADITTTLQEPWSPRTALVLCELAELAYFAFEDSDGPRQLGVRLRPGAFTLAATFSAGCTQAYLAQAAHVAVLAFRGTVDRAGWRTNLDARLVQMAGAPEGLLVHEGFHAAYDAVRARIAAAVAQLPASMPLYVAGHSLGGALAQLATAAIDADRGTVAACYTFGSPRVATLAFDGLVRAPHYRVVHDKDLVPAVPPAGPGFRHTGDPRLLLPKPPAPGLRPGGGAVGYEVLRRDRGLLDRMLVDAMTSVSVLTTGRLPDVEDHMIWRYRAALERVVAGLSSHVAG